MEKQHATLSPSARHSWSRCPGRIRVTKGIKSKSGKSADDGTHTHTLLKLCLDWDVSPESFVGNELVDEVGKFTVDLDRAERVRVVTDYISSRIKEEGCASILSERELRNATWIGRDDCWGTADVALVGLGWFEIIDLKDGMGIVEAVENEQLETYAMLFAPDTGAMTKHSRVRMTIVQPKAVFAGKEPISSWDTTLGEIYNRVPVFQAQAAATDAADAPLIPGEKQCRFCPVSGNCSAQAAEVVSLFDSVDTVPTVEAVPPAVNTLTDIDLDRVMLAAPLLRGFLDGAEEEVFKRLNIGHTFANVKLVRGRGSSEWVNSEEETLAKLARMGIPKGLLTKEKILTPNQVKNLKWEVKGEKKSLSEFQKEKIEQNFVKRNEGALSVALMSDKRDAVITNTIDMYEEVT